MSAAHARPEIPKVPPPGGGLPLARALRALPFKLAVWWTSIIRYHGFHALGKRRIFPRFSSTRRNMPAFKPFLQYFGKGWLTPLHLKITRSTNLLSVCRRKLKLSSYLQSLTNSRGSRVAGRGSRVQSRGRGSNVAAGENDLEFEVTAEWKRLTWTQYKGKKSFLCTILYGRQFTGYGCESQQNNVLRKDLKEKAGRLLCSPQVHFVFFLSDPVMCKLSFECTYA